MKRLIIILLFPIIASGAVFINSFNSGQLSPKMKNRIDTDKRSMGVETLENMMVRPQGMTYRRNGTEYIADVEKGDILYEDALVDYYNTGYTPSSKTYWTNRSGTSLWLSQTFTASKSYDITKVKLLLDIDGSYGNVTVSIRNTNDSGIPDGNDLCSSVVDAHNWVADDDGTWYEFEFDTSTSLIEGHKYSIVLRADFRIIKWRYKQVGNYSGGNGLTSVNSGDTWTPNAWDFYFEVYYERGYYDYTHNIRLIPFEYSNTDAYVLEFSNGQIGFFRTIQ